MILISASAFAANSVPSAGAAGSPGPAAAGTGISIDESQKVEFPLTPQDKKKLDRDFKKALIDETRALERQEKSSTRELNSNQATKSKNWRDQERKARRSFFAAHASGPERRQYVQDYQHRRDDFENQQKDELAASRVLWRQKAEQLKQSQKERSAQFKNALDQNNRPNSALWPIVK